MPDVVQPPIPEPTLIVQPGGPLTQPSPIPPPTNLIPPTGEPPVPVAPVKVPSLALTYGGILGAVVLSLVAWNAALKNERAASVPVVAPAKIAAPVTPAPEPVKQEPAAKEPGVSDVTAVVDSKIPLDHATTCDQVCIGLSYKSGDWNTTESSCHCNR